MKDLSIAIASWNTKDLLHQCLESIYGTTSDIDYEIIVVDNASGDGSPDMVAESHPDVKLVRNRVNLGFAAACNIAFKHSEGRYFLLLNTDTIVLDNAFKKMVTFMDLHPDTGITGCKLLNADGSLQRSCSCFPSVKTELFDSLYLSKLFPKSKFFGCYSMNYWNFNDTREVDFAGGSCLIVRREAIEEVGLMDEGYFMYTEEADWCYRMWMQDWKVYFYPGAQIIHLGGQSSKKYGSDILLHLYASRNRFIHKHQGMIMAELHRFAIAIGALLRLGAFSIKHIRNRNMDEAVRFHLNLLKWTIRGRSTLVSAIDPRVPA
ncbi:MAG: glycosyltransferase family 2 protein [Armatimonadota bacterium]